MLDYNLKSVQTQMKNFFNDVFGPVGWFLGESVRGVGHVVATLGGAPFELTTVALNGIGDVTGVQTFKDIGKVTNIVPSKVHEAVDGWVANPIDNTMLLGTVVRSGQASGKGIECMNMPTNDLGDRAAKNRCEREQERLFNKAKSNAINDVVGAALGEVGGVALRQGGRVMQNALTRSATREAEQAAERVIVTERAANAARDAVTQAIAEDGREVVTQRALLDLATSPSRTVIVGAENEATQIAALNAVKKTENALAKTLTEKKVIEATRKAEVAMAENATAKKAAAEAEKKLNARLAAKEAESAAAREWKQKTTLQKFIERNPFEVMPVPPPARPKVHPPAVPGSEPKPLIPLEPHTRPNNGKSDRQDPTLNHGIDADLLFRDALLAPREVMNDNGKVVDTTYNLGYSLILLIAAAALVSEVRS